MSGNRARRSTLSLLLAAAVVVLGAPAASADPVNPVGIGVVRPNYANRGLFFAPAWTDSAGATITSVSASVRSGATVVATVPLTDPDPDGVWTPADPLKLTADGGTIPQLGRYALDITATDSLGGQATRSDADTLDFTLLPMFAPTYSPQLTFTTVTRQHQATAVTGTLVGEKPGGFDTVPLEGESVTVTQTYGTGVTDPPAPVSETVTTGADGTFTTAEFPQTLGYATYRATFAATGDQIDGTADSGATGPGVTPTPVYVTAQADRARVEPGQRFTLSGTVRSGATSTAPVVSGVPVALGLSSNPEYSATVTTDANGRFSASIVAVAGNYVSWTATPSGWLFAGDTVSGTIVVPDESTYTAFGISLASTGRVSAHAVLSRTYVPNQAVYNQQTTYLEYSFDGKTGWHALASTKGTYGTVTVSAWGYAHAYYRLRHPTSDELAATVSRTVYLSRYPTRVYGLNAGPEPVAKGGTVTVTGTLQEYRSGIRAIAYRPVRLYFEKLGTTTFTYVTAGRTDAYGRITLRGKATYSGSWLLQYFGDSTHFDSDATPDYVSVR